MLLDDDYSQMRKDKYCSDDKLHNYTLSSLLQIHSFIS